MLLSAKKDITLDEKTNDDIRTYVKRQEKFEYHIQQIEDKIEELKEKIAVLKDEKEKIKTAYDDNQIALTNTLLDLNTDHLTVDNKELVIKYSTRVEVSDKTKIPAEYLRDRITTTVDKRKIGAVLAEHPDVDIDGAALVTRARTVINPGRNQWH